MPDVVGRLRPPRLAGAPASPAVGELYYNTGNNTLYYWNGTAWAGAGVGASGPAGGDLTGTYPNPQAPGAELGYAQITAPVSVTSASEATGNLCITAPSITFNGNPVM